MPFSFDKVATNQITDKLKRIMHKRRYWNPTDPQNPKTYPFGFLEYETGAAARKTVFYSIDGDDVYYLTSLCNISPAQLFLQQLNTYLGFMVKYPEKEDELANIHYVGKYNRHEGNVPCELTPSLIKNLQKDVGRCLSVITVRRVNPVTY